MTKMTLPCVFYHVGEQDFEKMMGVFHTVFGNGQGNFRVDARFANVEQAVKYLAQRNIHLLVTYVSAHRDENGRSMPDVEAIRLGQIAARANRDNYIIYLAHDNETLLRMAPACVRAVASMTLSMFLQRGQAALTAIREDYGKLTTGDEPDESQWLCVKSPGGAVKRVHPSQLYAVMAESKELVLHTEEGVFKAYGTLVHLKQQLGDAFCQCHRSCLVNLNAIQDVDFAGLTISLKDGSTAPLAKSFRQTMRQLLQAKT